MNFAAIEHRPLSEYAFALDDTHYVFRLRTQMGDVDTCRFYFADRAQMGPLAFWQRDMKVLYEDKYYRWFEIRLTTSFNRIAYYFRLKNSQEDVCYIGGTFLASNDVERSDYFQFSFNHRADRLKVPAWARDAIVYNIFPDSFATHCEEITAQPQTRLWHGKTSRSLLGGTLRGIQESLDYIQDMGFNCIYLNPIFAAGCYHKYDTLDYFHIDPCFGTDEDFHQLVEDVHRRGMHILIDGVFNHVSSQHPFFEDVLKHGRSSDYYEWFYQLPDHPQLPADGEEPAYTCFSYVPEMPKMDLSYPAAREYFCEVGRYWIREFHVDGWRLDVANEVDLGFLRSFRLAVKQEKPDALIIGEVWEDGACYLQGDMLDSCMNYDFRRFARAFFAKREISAEDFSVRLHWLLTRYKEPALYAQLNLLDSHDVNRFLSEAKGDVQAMEAAIVFQMTMPGMPSVFYGDELGLQGAAEPEYRQAMPWGRQHPLKDVYQRMIGLRKSHASLREGVYHCEQASQGLLHYTMTNDCEQLHICFNMNENPVTMKKMEGILAQNEFECDILLPKGYVIWQSKG